MRHLAAFAASARWHWLAACRQEPEGAVKVIAIGGAPTLKDPALGSLAFPDQVLLTNAAEGLVRFDPTGNIVGGLAERWTVSDDGLSYIFRLAARNWPDGRKITADQVARLLKRQLASRSKNGLKDNLGAIEDIVAMTDRVIEISLVAPRPDLLSFLAQPQMAILRNGQGTGPFTRDPGTRRSNKAQPRDRLARRRNHDEAGIAARRRGAEDAIRAFAAAQADLVLGGTFADLPWAQRVKLPRNSLRFDPASGLFGLVPLRSGGPLDKAEVRHLLSEAIERDTFVSALSVPGLSARATLLEPGLDGNPAPPARPGRRRPMPTGSPGSRPAPSGCC